MNFSEYTTKKTAEILGVLKTSENGLTEKEAEARLEKYGLNEIQQLKKINPIKNLP